MTYQSATFLFHLMVEIVLVRPPVAEMGGESPMGRSEGTSTETQMPLPHCVARVTQGVQVLRQDLLVQVEAPAALIGDHVALHALRGFFHHQSYVD